MLLMCYGDIWRENYHLDTTLFCRGGELTFWPIRELHMAFFTKDNIGLNIFFEGLQILYKLQII